jgi:hypothetical protein
MKVIPPIKVRDMEFIEGNCTREIAERNGAIMANGQKNYYRVMIMKGQLDLQERKRGAGTVTSIRAVKAGSRGGIKQVAQDLLFMTSENAKPFPICNPLFHMT